MKNFILNADDFGMSREFNDAVLLGYDKGLLKSASLVANGLEFADAVERVIPSCKDLSIGVHLNIIEGYSLTERPTLLVNNEQKFSNSYTDLLKKAYGSDKKLFMEQVEVEFRAQIEKIISKTKVSHIDSHVHTHSIPKIFDLVCRLANEYKIKYVRTQFEIPYIVPERKMIFNNKLPINIIKNLLLTGFTLINKHTIKKYELKTNNFLVGILYTSIMDNRTICHGLKNIPDSSITEALIHPCKYTDERQDNHYTEFLITQNDELKNSIENMGFKITNYNS
ncbi:MAG: ChbG/HpnK family deacetylase [bacterium]|nr:ChbG/HpnK family deacetylase [bacterium]